MAEEIDPGRDQGVSLGTVELFNVLMSSSVLFRSRDRDSHRDRSRDGSRLPHGERRGKKDRDRSESPNEPPKKWVSRVKNRKSNFDVRPPDGETFVLQLAICF